MGSGRRSQRGDETVLRRTSCRVLPEVWARFERIRYPCRTAFVNFAYAEFHSYSSFHCPFYNHEFFLRLRWLILILSTRCPLINGQWKTKPTRGRDRFAQGYLVESCLRFGPASRVFVILAALPLSTSRMRSSILILPFTARFTITNSSIACASSLYLVGILLLAIRF